MTSQGPSLKPQLQKELSPPANVLLVDVSPVRRIADTLRQHGFQVTEASSGREAFRLFQQKVFNAVVSDLQMPDGNGIELFRWIREQRRVPPFFLMTGNPKLILEPDEPELLHSYLLIKPFRPEDLIARLTGALRLPRK